MLQIIRNWKKIMTKKIRNAFIDTDIIQKIGGFRRENLLSKILMDLGYNLYIHEYLVEEELILKGNALDQFNKLISDKKIIVIKDSSLGKDESTEYNSTMNLLANEMNVDLSRKRDRNAGEVKSMAMAYAKGFGYFISDDRGARVAAKKHLQNLDGSCMETIRMRDIILHIYNNEERMGISRKTAKRLYLYGTNPKLGKNTAQIKTLEKIINKLKKDFDENLWPI